MRKIIMRVKSKFFLLLYKSIYNKNLKSDSKINWFCKFNGKEKFGENVNFNGCKVYGKGVVEFGDNFHSARGLKILTSFHNYKGSKLPYDHTVITKKVIIEDNVWVGMDVLILGGVTIGEGAIIQAGSVVVKDIPEYAICGGSPASPFSYRDIPHYNELKSKKQFL